MKGRKERGRKFRDGQTYRGVLDPVVRHFEDLQEALDTLVVGIEEGFAGYGQGAGNGNALLATGEVIGVGLCLMPQTYLLSQDAGEKITAWVYIPPVSKQA
ncbi:hypothetical protein [Rothia nasisuis]|uniref:hypothetical protein n=1 Tax=Rothia nasisuis TaxID=2109647 RepID=UPI001F1F3A82|nr:hypothetical protein [Rothia nasisuis]